MLEQLLLLAKQLWFLSSSLPCSLHLKGGALLHLRLHLKGDALLHLRLHLPPHYLLRLPPLISSAAVA